MPPVAQACLAFYDALARIDAEKRQPTAIEDFSLRAARACLPSDPDRAIQLLLNVPDNFSRNHVGQGKAYPRSVAEWREDLRRLSN